MKLFLSGFARLLTLALFLFAAGPAAAQLPGVRVVRLADFTNGIVSPNGRLAPIEGAPGLSRFNAIGHGARYVLASGTAPVDPLRRPTHDFALELDWSRMRVVRLVQLGSLVPDYIWPSLRDSGDRYPAFASGMAGDGSRILGQGSSGRLHADPARSDRNTPSLLWHNPFSGGKDPVFQQRFAPPRPLFIQEVLSATARFNQPDPIAPRDLLVQALSPGGHYAAGTATFLFEPEQGGLQTRPFVTRIYSGVQVEHDRPGQYLAVSDRGIGAGFELRDAVELPLLGTRVLTLPEDIFPGAVASPGRVTAISADGRTAAGLMQDPRPDRNSRMTPFLWRSGHGTEFLEPPSGAPAWDDGLTEALLSADGGVAVFHGPGSLVGFRRPNYLWTRETGALAFDAAIGAASGETITITSLSADGHCLGIVSSVSSEPALVCWAPPVGLRDLSVNPGRLTGGWGATGTVSLTGKAPAGGLVVTLSSASPAATVPASVTVPAGRTTAEFAVATAAVTTNTPVELSAQLAQRSVAATLELLPPVPTGPELIALKLTPSATTGGQSVTGLVELAEPAPPGGVEVEVRPSNPGASCLPRVTVPGGQSQAEFLVTTDVFYLNDREVRFTANLPGSPNVQRARLTLSPAASVILQSLGITQPVVEGGLPTTATLTLTGPAPAGGFRVPLTSTRPEALVPPFVDVPEGNRDARFTVTTRRVADTVEPELRATLDAPWGESLITAKLRLVPGAAGGAPMLRSLTADVAVAGAGQPVPFTVTLFAPAPAGGLPLAARTGSGSFTLPASLAVPAGATSLTFQATAVVVFPFGHEETVTVEHTLPDGAKESVATSVRVLPGALPAPEVRGELTLLPGTVTGGTPLTGRFELFQDVPAGGLRVRLQSPDPGLATLPDELWFPAGSTERVRTFVITTRTVAAPVTLALRAQADGQPAPSVASLQIEPPPASNLRLASLAVLPGEVQHRAEAVLRLAAPLPAGQFTITFQADPDVLPAPVTFNLQGGVSTRLTFPVTVPLVPFNGPGDARSIRLSAALGAETVATEFRQTRGPAAGSQGGLTVTALPQVQIGGYPLDLEIVPASPTGVPALGHWGLIESAAPDLIANQPFVTLPGQGGAVVSLATAVVTELTEVPLTVRWAGGLARVNVFLLPAEFGGLAGLADTLTPPGTPTREPGRADVRDLLAGRDPADKGPRELPRQPQDGATGAQNLEWELPVNPALLDRVRFRGVTSFDPTGADVPLELELEDGTAPLRRLRVRLLDEGSRPQGFIVLEPKEP